MQDVRELLDWDELSYLSRRGFDIEAHGLSHAILTEAILHQVRHEFSGSLTALREHGHGQHVLFAYPWGQFNAEVARLAGEVGYIGAVTTRPGLARAREDPLGLPRIGRHQDISSTRLEFLRWVPGRARKVERISD